MSLVLVPVSVLGLRARLLLPDEAKIVGAGTIQHFSSVFPEADTLILTVDMPGVPDGAVTAEVVCANTGHRDPVEFERIVYRAADGTEVTPEAVE